jgi:N-acetylglucosaminyldiphosphoundecaprenol N-acetyl-beta-D-mannosaminyltransferase
LREQLRIHAGSTNVTSTTEIVPGFATTAMGGLPIVAMTRAEAAAFFELVAEEPRDPRRRPFYVTSANGEVLSRVARNALVRASFEAADMIHADGQAMVLASRLGTGTRLPERVATTDLFHDSARLAERSGKAFYLLGGSKETMAAALERVRRLYPRLNIVGARDGYFAPEEEEAVVEAINAARPDILWVGMGVPVEQRFVLRNLDRLTGVGVIKTSGGLFDFLSGRRSRAPGWMQAVGLEWLYRLMLEPRRLAVRYLTTSPHAALILLRDAALS